MIINFDFSIFSIVKNFVTIQRNFKKVKIIEEKA